MSAECYPASVLPHATRLYTDYLALSERVADDPLRRWYGAGAGGNEWMNDKADVLHRAALADALHRQSTTFGAGVRTFEKIEKLRNGARAVVTGQQVGLFGGPLLTMLKAATAIAKAAEATRTTSVEHVPLFWLASEDHDLDEVDQVSMLSKGSLETLRLGLEAGGRPVGGVQLGAGVNELLDQAAELLSFAPVVDTLRACYTPDATLAGAFARLLTSLFGDHGLIVMDAAGRDFHTLGSSTLQAAITHADRFEERLLARTAELEAEGYHAQVLVKPGTSLLFLIDAETGAREVLKRSADGNWKAGARTYRTDELLGILAREPERISPNALLRPVFQDTILPTAAYIGGPAEVAYFAQCSVLYEAILGHVTPVLPRFSATLIEPAIASVMAKDEVSLGQIFEARSVEVLTQRLGARAIPIEGKRRLAAVGNAMDAELSALTDYLEQMDESLGRSALVSASKMRYQMNRLRRMAATFEVQKEASLSKHAAAMMLHLFPDGHPQERVIAGVWFLAQAGEGLIDRLVAEAATMCTGHTVVRL